MSSETRRQQVHIPIHVRHVEAGLQPRVIALARPEAPHPRTLVLISDGAGSLRSGAPAGGGERLLGGPGLFWLARPSERRLTLEAGTTGYVAEVADETIARAVGDFAESATLMFMVDRDMQLSFGPADTALRQFAGHLGAINEELVRPQIGGSMQIVAHLRIVLVMMMRLSGIEEVAGTGGETHFLQRFRQLVEGHYRDHWPVARYAGELGITHDRLHAICRRELAKTPKALIAERLAREAGLALERSTLSVEQVSDMLGFRDPAHFSNFFKKMTGLAPGRFRKLAVSGAGDFSPPSFADWP
jgi:AraC family transcriptional regulator, transcriptional activator of pobA